MINIILNIILIVLFLLIIICSCLLRKSQKSDKFHIFVINLSRSKDRLDNFKKYYKEMARPIPLTRVEAVDKKDIVNTQMLKKWHESISLNPQFKSKEEYDKFIKISVGTNALQLSNVKCLKIGKQKKPEWTILCEDDAELPKDVNFEELARSTDDFYGAQCKAVCVEAGMIALRREATVVTHEDFMDAILEVSAKKKQNLNYYA